MATKIRIDTAALGVTWAPGTYTLNIPTGFVKSAVNNDPSVQSTTTFTITGLTLSGGSTNNLDSQFINLTSDRTFVKVSGNIYLHKSDGTLIKTYDVTSSDVTIENYTEGSVNKSRLKLNIGGLTEASNSYYVLVNGGVVKDIDNILSTAVTNTSSLVFTNSSLFSKDFVYVVNPTSTYPSSDINVPLGFIPTIVSTPYDTGTYSMDVVWRSGPALIAGDVNSVSNVASSGGGTVSWNSGTTTYTITGNRNQIIERLNSLTFSPGPSVNDSGYYYLDYKLTNPLGQLSTITMNLSRNNIDSDLTGTYQYVSLQSNYCFVGAEIVDPANDPTAIHEITFDSEGNGFFALETSGTILTTFVNPFVLLGTKAEIDFSKVVFWPAKTDYQNSITSKRYGYTRKTNGVVRTTLKKYLNRLGDTDNSNLHITFLNYQSAPEKLTGTWRPTLDQLYYASQVKLTMVGGGGAGGGYSNRSGYGGNGGGIFTRNITGLTVQDYAYTVGGGGIGFYLGQSGVGQPGGHTTMFGYIATGSTGGNTTSGGVGQGNTTQAPTKDGKAITYRHPTAGIITRKMGAGGGSSLGGVYGGVLGGNDGGVAVGGGYTGLNNSFGGGGGGNDGTNRSAIERAGRGGMIYIELVPAPK